MPLPFPLEVTDVLADLFPDVIWLMFILEVRPLFDNISTGNHDRDGIPAAGYRLRPLDEVFCFRWVCLLPRRSIWEFFFWFEA